jgi:hypothetical protein
MSEANGATDRSAPITLQRNTKYGSWTEDVPPSAPGSSMTIYMATPETAIHHTVGVEVMTADSLLSATERVAAYIYEDLRELAFNTDISLAQVVDVPPVSTNDPNLFHRLLCLDIEHLLRDRHTTDVALLLSEPAPDPDGRVRLRYRSSYHVVRLVDWAKSVDFPDSIADSPPQSRIARYGDRLDPQRYATAADPDARFTLAVKWNPQTATTREVGMRYPHYHFRWSPAGNIVFDDDALRAATPPRPVASNGKAPVTGPLSPLPQPQSQAAGLSPQMDGVWTLNAIRHTVPHAYRPRPVNKPR